MTTLTFVLHIDASTETQKVGHIIINALPKKHIKQFIVSSGSCSCGICLKKSHGGSFTSHHCQLSTWRNKNLC